MNYTVGIIGCGTMGSGIAQVAATADCEVLVFDTNDSALTSSQQKLDNILTRLIEKEKISTQKKESILNNINYVNDLSSLSECNLVIEAAIEDLTIKHQIFKELERKVDDSCIIASNTSSLSITSLAASLNKPERFIGIHFFNPAPLMKLVEIIPAIQTKKEKVEQAREIIVSWNKVTVMAKDTPGFIVNKVARPFYGESLRIYEEGIADIATLDWAMTEVGGFKMGPFELMDFIGNDINYTVTETVFRSFFYDSRYRPAFTQKRLYEAGYLGRKTGRGYYDYSENSKSPEPHQNFELGRIIVDRVVAMLVNEAADTVHMGIASKEDIDMAMTTGVNYPIGLFRWADEIGVEECINRIDRLFDTYHEERYRCSPLLRKMYKTGERFYKKSND